MGTAITPTKVAGVAQVGEGGWDEAIYTLLLDTTTATGYQTIDLTDDFEYIYGVEVLGGLLEQENTFTFVKPAPTTALTATNLEMWFHQVSDAASVDSTDLAAVHTGVTIKVIGKRAI